MLNLYIEMNHLPQLFSSDDAICHGLPGQELPSLSCSLVWPFLGTLVWAAVLCKLEVSDPLEPLLWVVGDDGRPCGVPVHFRSRVFHLNPEPKLVVGLQVAWWWLFPQNLEYFVQVQRPSSNLSNLNIYKALGQKALRKLFEKMAWPTMKYYIPLDSA